MGTEGFYTLLLVCDYDMIDPNAEHTTAEFRGITRQEAMKQARASNWLLRNRGEVVCPLCVELGKKKTEAEKQRKRENSEALRTGSFLQRKAGQK